MQQTLLKDVQATAAIVPLFNLLPSHPDWFTKQMYYLDNLHSYSTSGNCPDTFYFKYSHGDANTVQLRNLYSFKGIFHCIGQQDYRLEITVPIVYKGSFYQLVTLSPAIDLALQSLLDKSYMVFYHRIDRAGSWLLVEHITNNYKK